MKDNSIFRLITIPKKIHHLHFFWFDFDMKFSCLGHEMLIFTSHLSPQNHNLTQSPNMKEKYSQNLHLWKKERQEDRKSRQNSTDQNTEKEMMTIIWIFIKTYVELSPSYFLIVVTLLVALLLWRRRKKIQKALQLNFNLPKHFV